MALVLDETARVEVDEGCCRRDGAGGLVMTLSVPIDAVTGHLPGTMSATTQTVAVAVTDLNDSPPVFEAGDALPVREDVAVHDDAAQRGDAAVIHRVRARCGRRHGGLQPEGGR